MEVEKNGFLKVAIIRTVCLQECLLRELPLKVKHKPNYDL